MRRGGFYFRSEDPDPMRSKGQVRVIERDGFVCSHCGKAVFVEPFCDPADMGGRCNLCSDNKDPLKGLICRRCVINSICVPFERALEMVERGEIRFDQIGKVRYYGR